jgi:cytochrome c biogenesis protein ResB
MLPSQVRPWGDLLFLLGFARIFQSPWFWVPLAVLLLSSLVALADYAGPSWWRARKSAAVIEWQHPLARRVEHSVRLPASPDTFLDKLKTRLEANGFSVDAPFEENQRWVSAARWRWTWLGVISLYSGLILLCGSFLVSHYSLKTESLTLSPLERETSQLFGGTFELYRIDAGGGSGIVVFRPKKGTEQPIRAFIWQLYQPVFFIRTFILPIATEPIVTVEAQDETGDLRRLLPLQEDLSPATRLNLSLGEAGEPLYFLIPSASLAFQITPLTESGESRYNVQIRRGSESSPSENLMVKSGETFELDDLAVTISPGHNVRITARRDLALPLYAISIIVILVSGLLLFFRSPWQVWLMPEIKGRGGQLYGVVEKFGSTRNTPEFLEQLLTEKPEAEV